MTRELLPYDGHHAREGTVALPPAISAVCSMHPLNWRLSCAT